MAIKWAQASTSQESENDYLCSSISAWFFGKAGYAYSKLLAVLAYSNLIAITVKMHNVTC